MAEQHISYLMNIIKEKDRKIRRLQAIIREQHHQHSRLTGTLTPFMLADHKKQEAYMKECESRIREVEAENISLKMAVFGHWVEPLPEPASTSYDMDIYMPDQEPSPPAAVPCLGRPRTPARPIPGRLANMTSASRPY